MEYDKTYKSFMSYVDKCRELIKNTFFTYDDAYNLHYGSIEKLDINDIVRNHRLKMIDIKLEHSMRMIEQIIKINNNLCLRIDLGTIIKIATLYHDIGRIGQATWCNTFSDDIYRKKNMPFSNHGEEGYDIFLNNKFNVYDKYVPVVGKVILHHLDYQSIPNLNYRFDSELSNIGIDNILTGKFELNELELQIVSLIVQLVADVDKSDILYQHLSDDFGMIREYVYDYSKDSLDNISRKWGVSKEEIVNFNKIDERSYTPKNIKVPVLNMPLSKLEVPNYMKGMFYSNSWPELKLLIQDKNWNFITVLWWRISFFLNSIVFTSTLINIEESKLLEQIYNKIPDRFKVLVCDAFEYANDVLVNDRIQKNHGKIYLKK